MPPHLFTYIPSMGDIDITGAVFHGHWARVLEEAREDLHGTELVRQMAKDGCGWVVKSFTIQFKDRPVGLGDLANIETTVAVVGGAHSPLYSTTHRVVVDDVEVATARAELCFCASYGSEGKSRPVAVPKNLREIAAHYSDGRISIPTGSLAYPYEAGMTFNLEHLFTKSQVSRFGRCIGDLNELHDTTEKPFAHGALTNAMFSTIMASLVQRCAIAKFESKFVKPIMLNTSVVYSGVVKKVFSLGGSQFAKIQATVTEKETGHMLLESDFMATQIRPTRQSIAYM